MLLVLAIAGLFVLPMPWAAVAVVVAAVIEVLEFHLWRRFLGRYRIQSGAEAMIGARAEVLEGCSPNGRVRVGAEIWNARSEVPVTKDQAVRITAVDGLTLSVEPLEETA